MAKLTPDSPSLSITSSTTSTTTTSNTSSSPKNTLSSLPPLSITTHLPPTNKEDEQAKETELLRRIYSTSLGFQAWIEKLNKRSPINLRLFTVPFCKATVKRISSLESFYAQSSIIRFLLRKGFPPVLLFLSTTSGMVWFLKRFYLRNKYLAINCLGVLYPTWRCWQLVKRLDTHGEPMDQIKECKSWLAYWMVYGSLQVLDNWGADIILNVPNYNIYKLLILYWAQNPHSKGSTIIYQYILQKPEDEEEEKEKEADGKEKRVQQHHAEYYDPFTNYSTSRRSSLLSKKSIRKPLFDQHEELTLTISHLNEEEEVDELNEGKNNNHHLQKEASYRVLDGYTPPPMTKIMHESSPSLSHFNKNHIDHGDHNSSSNYLNNNNINSKQGYPMMVPLETESAW